ncbi:MAG: SCO family protein [Desulfobacterales bacterium]|nr:SCO family protein [Desulfobacterales bacterium]
MARRVVLLFLVLFLLTGLPLAGTGADHGRDSGAEHGSHMDHSAMETGEMAEGHSAREHEKMVMEAEKQMPDAAAQVKVEERLGEYIDFSARFRDSNNREVDLSAIFDKPVIILPVYFMCTTICNFLQADLADVLNFIDGVPGKDFNIISVSFSDDEDASHARTSKRNYGNLVKRDIELDNWYYLTSDRENILKLTDSLGYYFVKKKKHFYIHPNAMVVLAEDGKIIRYLYGPDFLPFDVGMALSEARKGEPGISIKRGVLSFCFDYDPENKTYVFKMFRITGTAILILVVGFLFFLISPSRSKRRKGIQNKPPDV